MRRRTIVAAAIGLTALAAAPAAFARLWPGAAWQLQNVEAEIPAGALPPGPAVADLVAGANHFRARFDVPPIGSTRVSLPWLLYFNICYSWSLFFGGDSDMGSRIRWLWHFLALASIGAASFALVLHRLRRMCD